MKHNNLFIPPKPHTIWDQLAKTDLLLDYLLKYWDSNLNTNPELHSQLLESLYHYSSEPVEEIEHYFCLKYHNCLYNFLEKISQCRQQIATH